MQTGQVRTAAFPRLLPALTAPMLRDWTALLTAAFLVPVILYPHRWLIGTAVNAALVLTAVRAKSCRSIVPVVLLPSAGLAAVGALFGGPATSLLILPAVWCGNAVFAALIRLHRDSFLRETPRLLIAAAGAKTFLIFAFTLTLAMAGLVPQPFPMSFALMQIVTALSGGAAAWTLMHCFRD